MKEKKILWGIFIVAIALWGLDLWLNPYPSGSVTPFTVRSELTNLTGIVALFFMGLIMILAVRPKWLENLFGGLDKMYYLHKWAGIWAISAGGAHYLVRLSKKILALYFEKGPKIISEDSLLTPIHDFLLNYKGLAKDLGEYTVWILLIVLALTLWNKFSYKVWRYSHKIMGALFLVIVFHTVVLTPINYWYQPVGMLFLAIIIAGSICALISLLGLIGKKSKFLGKVVEIERFDEGIVEVTCELEGEWHHKAGQYAFFKHNRIEGAHPFTISSSDQGDNRVRFSIKALGDYTNQLQNNVSLGDKVEIEGPYGRFDFEKSHTKHQIWIGGGVGVTPFISWLEALQDNQNQEFEIDFYYSIRNREEGSLVPRLEALAENVPNLTLHVHYSEEMGYLTLDHLNIVKDEQGRSSEIWFCGPGGFGSILKKGLEQRNYPVHKKFHQEIFQMR